MRKVSEYRVVNLEGKLICETYARGMKEAEKNVQNWGLTKGNYTIRKPRRERKS